MPPQTALSARSDQKDLPPLVVSIAGTPQLAFSRVLLAEAGCAAWRLVELVSLDGRPFEAKLAWTSGDGAGAFAQVAVARSTRVCVYARSLTVEAANWSTAGRNRVLVNVADGNDPTRNQYEVVGAPQQGGPPIQIVPIPPFASRVRLETADPAQAPGTFIDVYDGTGALRSRTRLPAQPDQGVPVGFASNVGVSSPVPWRLVFLLNL